MVDAEHRQQWQLDPGSVRALAHGLHPDPFGVLGPHDSPEGRVIRAFLPGATKVVCSRGLSATPQHTSFASIGRMAFRKPKILIL
jgi:hypothetical protein